jgi:PAS domain S-box-containing protein
LFLIPQVVPMDQPTNEAEGRWSGRRARLLIQPFAAAVSQSAIPTLMADLGAEGVPIIFANDSFLKLTGLGEEEVLGCDLASVLADPKAVEHVATAVAVGEVLSLDVRVNRASGSSVWARLDSAPVFDPAGRPSMVFATVVNVDDRVRAVDGLADANQRFEQRVAERTRSLESALERSELLSREVTHRAKNSLALLGAMIDLKRRHARSPAEAEILRDISGRVRSIGTLQSLLGGLGSGRANVACAGLLARLTAELDEQTGVRVTLTETPSRELPADTALAVALCVTELVLNAQKHAFPDGREGAVTITARQDGSVLSVAVEDDGCGLPEGFDPAASQGLGMLVVLDQVGKLGGTLTCGAAPNGGARFEIRLPERGALSASSRPAAASHSR